MMEPPLFWEEENYYGLSEELLPHLHPDLRAALESEMQKGREIAQTVSKELDNLISILKAIPTTSSLSYIYHRLRTTKFEETIEAVMEQEMLTTAFVVAYGRLFAKSNGTCMLHRGDIPSHLRSVHDDLRDIRNQRYAHNGGHQSLGTSVGLAFSGKEFHIKVQMSLGLHLGGRDEWEELIKFIDAHMHERMFRIIGRLKEKTGVDWIFPEGSGPSWLGKYGK